MKASRTLGAQEMRGVLLPLLDRHLALPNVVIAEVVPFRAPEAEPERPDWWLGRLEWRGCRIPVISLERALGHARPTPKKGDRERIVVLNTLSGNPNLPHIGIYVLGTIRLARLSAVVLAPDETDPPATPLIRAALRVQDQPAWVPDLDELERVVLAAGG